MSTQVQSTGAQPGQWTEDGGKLLSQPFVNFIARRRIAISLIGFLSLMSYNLFIKGTIPLNPFDLTDLRTLIALAMLATGLGIRSWAAGTLNKSREVTQHGPYAIVRNPLYVGSFLMMFAFCVLLRDFASFLFVAGPICFVYWLQVQFEEKRLLFMFPNEWPDYACRVPRFIPNRMPRNAFQGWTKFEWLRNREYKAISASAFGLVAVFGWRLISSQIWV